MALLRYPSVFDIIGPVMVGPSSSHTAGAARIGKTARNMFSEQPDKVHIYLYESFAKTYKGHGTDIALVAGLLNMELDDRNLSNSLTMAEKQGMQVYFHVSDELVNHPNTAKLVMSKGDKTMSVTGISVGGGNAVITELNGFEVHLTGEYPTFLVIDQDVPGAVSKITGVFAQAGINIGTMWMDRESRGKQAAMVLEVDLQDKALVPGVLERILEIPNVCSAMFLE